jgi:hypothetical protein
MNKLLSFLSKPGNMVFSLLVMFALVVGLLKVSFSYYIEDSTNGTQLKLNTIDNRLSSNDLKNGVLYLSPYESKAITMSVTSYNEFESAYKLFYECENDITIEKFTDYDGILGAGETDKITVLVANPNNYKVEAKIFVENGYIGNSIVSDYNAI